MKRLRDLMFFLDQIKLKSLRNKFSIPFILSLFFHIFVVIILVLDFGLFKKGPSEKKQIEVALISKEKVDQMKKEINLQDIAKKSKNEKMQVVNNELTGKDKSPEATRFLGEKNQSFQRQTVAKNVDIFNKAGIGVKDGDKKIDEKKKKVVKNKEQQNKERNHLNLADLGLKQKKFEEYDKFKLTKKHNARLGTENGDINNIGLTANNDFIEDVQIGDVTNLNTIEFKYFGFYSRIRKQLEQHWGLSLREKAQKIYKSGRRLVQGENYITSIKVVLNVRGDIISVSIISSSGQQELDAAAIESFKKAGPFPNPPQGMLKDGYAVLEWGFVVKS